jgi:hypothetical protein
MEPERATPEILVSEGVIAEYLPALLHGLPAIVVDRGFRGSRRLCVFLLRINGERKNYGYCKRQGNL